MCVLLAVLRQIEWHWGPLHGAVRHVPGGYIDASRLHGQHMLWEQVPKLEPLMQLVDAQGNVRLRVNELQCRKLRCSKHCMIEVSTAIARSA